MKHLFRRIRRKTRSRITDLLSHKVRAQLARQASRRFEPLEPRLLLHNGPHAADPSYAPDSNFSIEADISIFVDSALVTIPSGSGQGIEALDSNGRIRFAPGPQNDFVNLGDFFQSWSDAPATGSPSTITLSDTQVFDNVANNQEYLQMFVNGVAIDEDFAGYDIHDGDDIVLIFGENPVVVINTNLEDILPATVNGEPVRGSWPIELRDDSAPGTVINFLNYTNDGDYDNAIFHRFVQDFVLQGGGFSSPTATFTDASQIDNIPTDPPITNEFNLSNLPLTIAMAKLGGDPNSATNQWFINLGDNSNNLDNQNGGFTVFGEVRDPSVLNSVTALTTSNEGGAFTDLPRGTNSDLLLIESITGDGTISGIKFEDLNNNGVRDAGEPGLAGFTIYTDDNGNDQLDAGEASTISGPDGSYALHVPGGQSYTVREVPLDPFTQTLPTNPDEYTVTVEVGREAAGFDFGNFRVDQPDGIDLLASSDSGTSNSDDLTNFNNSSATLAPSFQIGGVVANETVRVRIDGVIVAEQIVDAGGIITLDGVNTIADGEHTVTATTVVGGVEGESVSMTLTIDSTAPQINSQPPTTAIVDEAFTYNAESNEEGDAGFFYTLNDTQSGEPVNPSLGIILDSLSGAVTWTPVISQIGDHDFTLVATDSAGNVTAQPLEVNVSRVDLVRLILSVVDSSGNPVTEVTVGESFQLQVFVLDVRDSAAGVFSAYTDITFDSDLVSATGFTHGDNYGQGGVPNLIIDPPQTINDVLTSPGLLDEVGSFSSSIAPLGPTQRLLMTIDFTATGTGTFTFMTDPADVAAVHEVGLYNRDGGIPNDQIDFGTTTLTVLSNFRVLDPLIGPDEDSEGRTVVIEELAEFVGGAGGDLTITSVEQPSNGQVTVASDGKSLVYVPDADFFGPDPFEYTVSDGNGDGKGTVDVLVQPLNDEPTAVDDSFQDNNLFVVNEDAVSHFLPVVANDSSAPDDPNTETLSVNSVVAMSTQGGTLEISSNGQGVNYTPPPNFFGEDTFTYTVRDNLDGVSGNATVTVNVIMQNDPPIANDDSPTVVEDSGPTTFNVISNDETEAGETLTITAVGASPNGSTVTITNNMISYTPASDFTGTDSFTYTINDGNGGTAVGTVNVTVTNVADPPTANDDTGPEFRVTQNTNGNTLDVLDNDTGLPDPNDPLMIDSVSGVSAGATVTVAPDGQSVVYSPAAGFLGTDTFTYTILDGDGLSDTATVTVEVVEFDPGSVSGFVYIDTNNNGVRDPGERGLEGVTVTLTGTADLSNVNRTETTDSDGAYSFANLAPGTYTLRETQPAENVDNDGIPVLDGREAIGTQGGSLSANDELTITLAEGVDGTNNNFGEVKGRSLSGVFLTSATLPNSLGGVELQLFSAGNGSEPIRTQRVNAEGYSFDGLAPDDYQVVVASDLDFLFADTTLAATIVDANSTGNNLLVETRSAESLSYRDFVSFHSSSAAHAAVPAGGASQQWYTIDAGWTGVRDVAVQLSNDASTVTVEVTDVSGAVESGEIPTSHPQVQILSTLANGLNLIRLDGNRASFAGLLNPVSSNNDDTLTGGEGEDSLLDGAEGEGEGNQVQPPPILVQPPPALIPSFVQTETPDTAPATGLLSDTLLVNVPGSEFDADTAPPSEQSATEHQETVDTVLAGSAAAGTASGGVTELFEQPATDEEELLMAVDLVIGDEAALDELLV